MRAVVRRCGPSTGLSTPLNEGLRPLVRVCLPYTLRLKLKAWTACRAKEPSPRIFHIKCTQVTFILGLKEGEGRRGEESE